MKGRRVIAFDSELDISERVRSFKPILEQKSVGSANFLVNKYVFIVRNTDGSFSGNKLKVLLKDNKQPIKSFNRDGIKTWEGVIMSVDRDHKLKTAKFQSINKLHTFAKIKIDYETAAGTWETPIMAAKNIMDSYGFSNYDNGAIGKSDKQLTEKGILCWVNFNPSNSVNLIQGLGKLAEVGASEMFDHLNNLFLVHFEEFAGNTPYVINEADIDDEPYIWDSEPQVVNEYLINYNADNGIAATDQNSNNIAEKSREVFGLKELSRIDCGSGKMIELKDKAAAVALGEDYIRRNQTALTKPRSKKRFRMKLKPNLRSWLAVQIFFRFNFAPENWINKVFEMTRIKNDDLNNQFEIEALEV